MLSCEICNDLWQFFAEPDTKKKDINLGSFDEALASQCPDHTRILEAFKSYCDGDDDDESSGRDSNDVGFIKGDTNISTTLFESIKNRGQYWSLVAAKKQDVENHPGNGRVLKPDWVDLDLAIEWKKECLTSHGAQCENPMMVPLITPAWLVDVEKKCIVSGGDGRPYIAISYRSNDAVADDLYQTAFVELQKGGAFENPEILAQLPSKIRHAVSLTAAIGERYLWVDALCIDPSDRPTTSEQISQMTAIYAGAIFTVIAVDGDRADGIAGLEGISEPRKLSQKVFPIGNEHLIVRTINTFSLEHWHDYHNRGWTYQEFKMSPRKLLFMEGQVHWQCNCCVWHEELTLGSEIDKYKDLRPRVLSSGFPDLGSLDNMLSDYNKRELTFDEDALAAISGLLTLFSRSFTGGFLYGLPEMLFDSALAWQPQWPITNLRKRKTSGKPSRIGFTATDLPTWSWIAWQGMFTFQRGEAVRVNEREDWIKEVSPITEWYTSSAPSGQPLRRIRSTWFEERDRRKDVKQPLPEGWTRLPAPATGQFRNEPMLYPDGCGQYLYQHHAMPDDDCKNWYYPFDVPNIQLSTAYSVLEQTRYLFCKTWKASVWSHRTRG